MGANNNNNHHHHHQQAHHFPTKKLITRAIYALIFLALIHFYFSPFDSHQSTTFPDHPIIKNSFPNATPSFSSPAVAEREGVESLGTARVRCDYSDGRWVRDARGPLYNGMSCGTIKDGQNCMAHGRPDTGYLHWRWQPKECQLPAFDPVAFLRLVEDKHIAFVGDSMARNQLESLMCLLSSASAPRLVYQQGDDFKFRRWIFPSYNVTVSVFWSPFLVKGVEKSQAAGVNHNTLFLDSVDERWASELDRIDFVVLSVGHWFLLPAIFRESDAVIGCHHCRPEFNHTDIGFFDAFRKAFRTTLNAVSQRHVGSSSEKMVVVPTFTAAHFEGEWDKAGACRKTEPYQEGEVEIDYTVKELRKIAVEEVAAAAAAAKGGGRLRVEALDVTKLALLRPDGHPGPYMYPDPFANGVKDRVQNDCVHWCLPGPIDTWNQILLDMTKRWKQDLSQNFAE